MDAKDVFLKSFEIISDPQKFTRGESARDISNQSVDPTSPRAVCWCSAGAIRKIVGRTNTSLVETSLDEVHLQVIVTLDAAAETIDNDIDSIDNDFVYINDFHPYEDTLRMWQLAGEKNGWLAPNPT